MSDLGALRVNEDRLWARLHSVRIEAETAARRAEHMVARLDIYARALEPNAPFRNDASLASEPPADLESLKREETSLMLEAERVRRAIEARGLRRGLPLLRDVAIATPCDARWVDMIGDHLVRHCRACDKDVFNISQLDDVEAEALLREKAGKACIRLYRRTDGTVLTQDCPSALRRKSFRRLGLGVAFGLILAVGAAAVADIAAKASRHVGHSDTSAGGL